MFGQPNPSMVTPRDEQFRYLVEAIEDYAIYILDCAGHVMTWNRGAELNKGFAAADAMERNFRIFLLIRGWAGW